MITHGRDAVQGRCDAGGYVKFTLGKEMMPDNFNGTDRVKFSDWEFKILLERWRLRARNGQ